MPPQSTDSTFDRWFAEEVQPHESALRSWLKVRFASCPDIDDVVQESYIRILRARTTGKIEHPKAYLFSTARNAMLDRLRRARVVAFEPRRVFQSMTSKAG